MRHTTSAFVTIVLFSLFWVNWHWRNETGNPDDDRSSNIALSHATNSYGTDATDSPDTDLSSDDHLDVMPRGGCKVQVHRSRKGRRASRGQINPCSVFTDEASKPLLQSGPARCQWYHDWKRRNNGSNTSSKADYTPPIPTLYPTACNAGNKKQWRPGKCADDNAWLLPWMASRPGSDWTLVDVGANKGYVISGWLDALQQDSPYGPYLLAAGIYKSYGRSMTHGLASLCGGCCECIERPPDLPSAYRARSVRIHGFEPSVANFKWLQQFFAPRNVSSGKATIHLRHAAVSDVPSKLYFPDNAFGFETGKVKKDPLPGYVPVNILSLGDELRGKSILPNVMQEECLDVLSTDAEGFDQDVARGAEWFLREGRVGVYQFEMYREEDYQKVFERLKEWGYVCFYATASRRPPKNQPAADGQPQMKRKRRLPEVPKVIRITDCWDPDYAGYIGWVNGLCYNSRIPALQKIFHLLMQSPHRGGSGNCDSKKLQQKYATYFLKKFVDQHLTAEKVESIASET